MIIRLISVFVFVAALNSGCSLYQVEIQQGNYITPEQVAQVKPGMSQAQVQEILGTPLMTDDFRRNRWDYVFYQKNGQIPAKSAGATVLFNKNGVVSNLTTN